MRWARSSSEENTTARPSCSNSLGSAAERRQSIRCKPIPQGLPGDRQAIQVKKRLELAQKGGHSAGGKEILHITVPDRLEIDEDRGRVREPIDVIERNSDPCPAGDGGQMDDAIGG